MNELIAKLENIIKNDFDKKLKVLIVDDEVDARNEIPLEAWEEVSTYLKEEELEVWENLEKICRENFSQTLIETGPSLSEWNQLREKLKQNASVAMEKANEIVEKRQHPIAILHKIFKKLNVEVSYSSTLPENDFLADADLILLDYQIPPDNDGAIAKEILKQSMTISIEKNRDCPPFTILMSKEITTSQKSKWEGIAEKSCYFRFNYMFIEKQTFVDNQGILIVRIIDMISRKKLSSAYYCQINKISSITDKAKKDAANKLFGISPTDLYRFQNVLQEEGSPLSKVLLSLYGSLLQREIVSDSTANQCFLELDKAVKDSVTSYSILSGKRLDKLLAEVLNDDRALNTNSINFGDVFCFSGNNDEYEIIISQECDLLPRGDGNVNLEEVLLVVGKKVSLRDTQPKENIVYLPYCPKDSIRVLWIAWDLDKLKLRKYTSLLRQNSKRLFKMRFAEADDIQQKVASRLTRVANQVLPHRIEELNCKLFIEPIGFLPKTFNLTVVRSHKKHDKITEVALGPNIDIIIENVDKLGLTIENILKYRKFLNVKECQNLLKSKKIFFLGNEYPEILYHGDENKIPTDQKIWTS